jgi:hypothetical protein
MRSVRVSSSVRLTASPAPLGRAGYGDPLLVAESDAHPPRALDPAGNRLTLEKRVP